MRLITITEPKVKAYLVPAMIREVNFATGFAGALTLVPPSVSTRGGRERQVSVLDLGEAGSQHIIWDAPVTVIPHAENVKVWDDLDTRLRSQGEMDRFLGDSRRGFRVPEGVEHTRQPIYSQDAVEYAWKWWEVTW